ncbi:MAG: hypothetical protein QG655_1585 [Actinomycetota bacterium]|jgi:hypothetical protein|nr:hypothetical protein [Actinomycetota bacterium]HPY23529.1 ferritin-like domain-containing protein [Mycobacterium sp.]
MTSPTGPERPESPEQAALYDAVGAEHAAIYGYGVVSAYSLPTRNELISEAMAQHRERRESLVAMLAARDIPAPLPAAGYQLPMPVGSPPEAARLAVRIEDDCAVAWRAVLEQSESDEDRRVALTALTQCAVLAARWRRVIGAWPVTRAFPGGSE